MRAKQDSPAKRIAGSFILGVFAVICLNAAPDKRIRPEPAQADLDVTAVDITPNPPRASMDRVTIKITVMNRGSRATSARCPLPISIFSVDASGNKVAGDQIPPQGWAPSMVLYIPILEPGKAYSIVKSGHLRSPGRHCVSGVIDTESLSRGEEISTNNDFRVYFDVIEPPLPADLILEAIELTPEGRMKLFFRNAGAAIADADYNASRVMVKIDNKYFGSYSLKSIDPQGLLKIGGRQISLNYVWPSEGNSRILLQPGQSMMIEVILDENQRIYDSNRPNNDKTIILARRPD
jgi:hypothetical protein